jgi:hypothetical protein
MPSGVVLNSVPVHAGTYRWDPVYKDLPIFYDQLLRGGDLLGVIDEDGSRRNYRVIDNSRLPPGVHLAPHITFLGREPAPPPVPPEPEEPPVVGPSVWERLRQR